MTNRLVLFQLYNGSVRSVSHFLVSTRYGIYLLSYTVGLDVLFYILLLLLL